MEFIEDGSNQLSPRNRSNGLAALAIQPPSHAGYEQTIFSRGVGVMIQNMMFRCCMICSFAKLCVTPCYLSEHLRNSCCEFTRWLCRGAVTC